MYNYHTVSTICLFDNHSYSGTHTEFEILRASLLNIKALWDVTPLARWRLSHLEVSYTCPSNMFEVCVESFHGLKERVLPPREHKAKSSHANISGYEWILNTFETLRSKVNTLLTYYMEQSPS
jgi:hypothetical protein